MKIKIRRPVEHDVHFKYICPNKSCQDEHWLSLKEAQTKKFKIVCDYCGTIFAPKTIDNITINFLQNETNNNNKAVEVNLDKDLLVKATHSMISYGFTKQEAKKLIDYAAQKNPSFTCSQLGQLSLMK